MSDLHEIKNLIEEQGKAHASFESTIKDEVTKQGKTLEEVRANNAMAMEKAEKALNAYEDFKEKADELHAENERAKLAADAENMMKEEMSTFLNYAKMGEKAFHNATAMEVRSDPDGGYTVPQELASAIVTISEGNNPMAMLANRVTISGNSLDVIVDPDELGYSESTEGAAASGSTTPEIHKTNIPLKKIDAEPKATVELIQDSAWNVEQWLEDKAARIFRKRLNTQLTTGAGVDQCRGLMSYTATADATWAAAPNTYWGNVGYVASGNASTIPDPDGLIELAGSLQDVYLGSATWQMSRSTLNSIKQLKATTTTAGDNLYALWSPSLVPGQPDTLLGYPLYKNDAMAAIASNSLSVAFGDIGSAYTIVDKAGGMYMVRDPYTSKAYIKFYFARRMGGGITNFEAVKYLKVASS